MALTYSEAQRLDELDPIGYMRNRFYINDGELYMDGNSLGLMSIDSEESIISVMKDWKYLGIRGWMEADENWFYLSERLAKLQAPLMGALPEELTIHSSTTLNLHLLLATFYQPSGRRCKILVDELNFPTDIYAVRSFLEQRGLSPDDHMIIIASDDGHTLDEEKILDAIDDETALALLPGVLYRSGQLMDMKQIVDGAHQKGVIVGFDLSHAAGAVEHSLHDWGVDFAFWCNYKYFNGGPGSAASLFVHKKHLEKGPGLAGWFGYRKDKQFDLALEFEPSKTASAWEIGTPHVLSMASLLGSFNQFNECGMKALRSKSLQLTDYLMELIDERLAEYGFSIGTPREASRRGGHVALVHDEAARINEAMKEAGIIPDYREPNVIRLAPVPLYTRFVDVVDLVDRIQAIMEKGAHMKFENKRGTVA